MGAGRPLPQLVLTVEENNRLVEWARLGPPTALVDTVDAYDEEPERLTGFEIRPTA